MPTTDVYHADSQMPTRMSCDDKICEFGTQVLNLCKSNNLRIVNGRKIGNGLGKYTCYKWNGCSVVDYAIYLMVTSCDLSSHLKCLTSWTPGLVTAQLHVP